MSMQPGVPRPLSVCPVCHGPLRSVGRMPIRAQGGVFAMAQPGENQPAVGVDVYRCHDCGRLEFYDHDFLLPSY